MENAASPFHAEPKQLLVKMKVGTEAFIENMIRSNIVNREVDRRFPPAPEPEWLAHNRVVSLLAQKGAKILNVGNKGYPDLLFEVNGEVFAAEVKGEGDRLKAHQEQVLDALRRLKQVFVVRESGKRVHPDELTLDEFLSKVLEQKQNSPALQ
jgi:hypothetical protein